MFDRVDGKVIRGAGCSHGDFDPSGRPKDVSMLQKQIAVG